jgi:hypothetical protein
MKYVLEQRTALERRKLMMKIMLFSIEVLLLKKIGFMNNFVPVHKMKFMIYFSCYWNKTYL